MQDDEASTSTIFSLFSHATPPPPRPHGLIIPAVPPWPEASPFSPPSPPGSP